MSQDEAVRSGAMALFGEKYGDEVRVVSVGDWARELCGGTHAGRSGQLGVVKLLGESSIGSGVRRVEALVGADAYRFLAREHVLVAQLSEALKARPEELPERVADLVERLRGAEKEIERVRVGQLLAAGGDARRGAPRTSRGRPSSVTARTAPAPATCRKLALDVRGRMPAARPAWSRSSARPDGKPAVVVAVNDEARGAGALRERAGQGAPRPLSAAAAAARTTSRRAAAPTRPTPTRRSPTCAPRCRAADARVSRR